MRVSSRQTLALARVLLPFALAVSCALNPQPEGTGGAGGSGGTTGISLDAGHEDGGPTPTADATTDAMAGGDVSEDQSDVGVDVVPAQDAADAGSSGD